MATSSSKGDVSKQIEEAKRKLEQADAQHQFSKWKEQEAKKKKGLGGFEGKLASLFELITDLTGNDDKVEQKDEKPMEIGVPINIKHEGHIGFNSKEGGFTTRNLPPEYHQLFNNLDKTLREMGTTGVTEKEAKMILKALIPAAVPSSQSGLQKTSSNRQLVQPPKDEDLKTKLKIYQKTLRDLEEKLKLLESQNDQLESELTFSIHSVELLTVSNLEIRNEKAAVEYQLLSKKREFSMQILTQSQEQNLKKVKEDLNSLHDDFQKEIKNRTDLENENMKLKLEVEKLKSVKPPVLPPTMSKNRMESKEDIQLKESISIDDSSILGAPPPPPPPSRLRGSKIIQRKKQNEPVPEQPTTQTNDSSSGTRNNLMVAIRTANQNKLKHVNTNGEKQKTATFKFDDQNVLNLIAKALIQRRAQIKEDQDDNSTDDKLEDWL